MATAMANWPRLHNLNEISSFHFMQIANQFVVNLNIVRSNKTSDLINRYNMFRVEQDL